MEAKVSMMVSDIPMERRIVSSIASRSSPPPLSCLGQWNAIGYLPGCFTTISLMSGIGLANSSSPVTVYPY